MRSRTGWISSRFGERLLKLDVGMFEVDVPQALVLEGDRTRVFDAVSETYRSFIPDPPQGAAADTVYAVYSDAYLEKYLEAAMVLSARPLGRGSTRPLLLELGDQNVKMRGLFKSVD